MRIQFTAVYKKVPEGYIAYVENSRSQHPGRNPGRGPAEPREAIQLVLEANRALAEEQSGERMSS